MERKLLESWNRGRLIGLLVDFMGCTVQKKTADIADIDIAGQVNAYYKLYLLFFSVV